PCEADFFHAFPNLHTLGLDFTPPYLPNEYWAALLDPATEGPKSLPALRHLTLVGVEPVYAQELIYLRNSADQERLELLELILPDAEAVNARTTKWTAWLRQNVRCLSVTD